MIRKSDQRQDYLGKKQIPNHLRLIVLYYVNIDYICRAVYESIRHEKQVTTIGP
jgi:hypothetical protein